MADGYAWTVRHLVRTRIALAGALVVFVSPARSHLVHGTGRLAASYPRWTGYAIFVIQLPDVPLSTTDKGCPRASELSGVPGVKMSVAFAVFNGATFTNASNSGVIFTPPSDSFEDASSKSRARNRSSVRSSVPCKHSGGFHHRRSAHPPRGIGNSGGFKMQIMDRRAPTARALGLAHQMMGAANQTRGYRLFTTFTAPARNSSWRSIATRRGR